jgi:hypothetical protein
MFVPQTEPVGLQEYATAAALLTGALHDYSRGIRRDALDVQGEKKATIRRRVTDNTLAAQRKVVSRSRKYDGNLTVGGQSRDRSIGTRICLFQSRTHIQRSALQATDRSNGDALRLKVGEQRIENQYSIAGGFAFAWRARRQ